MLLVLEIMPLGTSAIAFIGDQLSYLREKGGYGMHLISTPMSGVAEFAEGEGASYYPLEIPRAIKPVQDLKNCGRFTGISASIR